MRAANDKNRFLKPFQINEVHHISSAIRSNYRRRCVTMQVSLPAELALGGGDDVLGVTFGSFGEACVTTPGAVTLFDSDASDVTVGENRAAQVWERGVDGHWSSWGARELNFGS